MCLDSKDKRTASWRKYGCKLVGKPQNVSKESWLLPLRAGDIVLIGVMWDGIGGGIPVKVGEWIDTPLEKRGKTIRGGLHLSRESFEYPMGYHCCTSQSELKKFTGNMTSNMPYRAVKVMVKEVVCTGKQDGAKCTVSMKFRILPEEEG